ncbi:MAG TPA: hypothetical protein PKA20_25005 [Burkholderiaceae bacterium]|nr:hypothetical protein [Burkholderiaceae bacterium]
MIKPGIVQGAAAAVWTPQALFTLGIRGGWYDVSDLTTLSVNSDGTGGIPAVGTAVGRVADKSGNGNHLAQATAANRPILRNPSTGKYYLEFDGTTDFIQPAAMAGANAADTFCTALAVQPTSLGAYHNLYEHTAAQYPMLWCSNANVLEIDGGATSTATGAALVVHTRHVSGSNGQFWPNNGTLQSPPKGGALYAADQPITLFNRGGSATYGGRWYGGTYIYADLTAQNRTDLQAFYAARL